MLTNGLDHRIPLILNPRKCSETSRQQAREQRILAIQQICQCLLLTEIQDYIPKSFFDVGEGNQQPVQFCHHKVLLGLKRIKGLWGQVERLL
jgi:hypothetical protein